MSAQLQVTGEAKIRDIQGPVVANSGVITALDGAASQYVRGDGTLADFPTSSGGGSSVSYYLNSSVSQGTIGGVAYRELSKDPIIGAGTDIPISANGYVANYITDVNDPDVTIIPGGNFNCEFYFSVNNNTGNPSFYAELYKYDGTTFTLLGTSAGVPESINQGTTIAPYYFAIPVATAALSVTDRLAIRIYVNVDGRTVTLHTENGHLCQVVTTLSKGMVSLNNLTDQSQYLATGTSGTNFAIVSSGDTHTFNLPVASATNTGKLSSTDWTTFNGKQPAGNYVTLDTTQTITAAKTFSLDILVNSLTIGRGAGAIATNTAIGSGALAVNTTGNENTAIGSQSLAANTTGVQNTGIGRNTLASNTTGYGNFAGGFGCLPINTTGAHNIAIGGAALSNNTTADYNIAIGLFAGGFTTGSRNIAIGPSAGSFILTGSNNTIIGNFIGTSAMANNIVLADGAGNVRYRYDGTNNNLYGNVNFSSTIGNGTYTYTLPSATGTLALTSDLSAYLPLTGGTLTGALSGTSATFSGSLGVNSTIRSTGQTDPTSGVGMELFYRAADTSSYIQSYDRTNGAWKDVRIYGNTLYFGTQGTNNLTIASTGAATFSSSVTATSGNAASLLLRSGNAAQYTFIGIGRTSNDMAVGVSAAAGQFFIGSVAGDAWVGATNGTIGLGNDTSGTATMVIKGGNVGIGTSSPSYKLHVSGSAGTLARITDGTNNLDFYAGSGLNEIAATTTMLFSTSNAERMRITSGGNVGIGTTTVNCKLQVLDGQIGVGSTGSGGQGLYLFINNALSDNSYLSRGSAGSGTTTWYIGNQAITTSSDIRLKENISNTTRVATEIINKIRIVDHSWNDPSDTCINNKNSRGLWMGLIAQEAIEHIPWLVNKPLQDENEDGSKNYWNMDFAYSVPLLMKAIQEQQIQIDELKALINK